MKPIPKDADEFVSQQLDERLRALENAFDADAVSFSGGLVDGADDIIRAVIEELRRSSARPSQLVFILTTFGGYIEVVQRIVDTLRHHYQRVEFVIPNHAFSAGTVLAMSGDAIHMDYYSRLGPIDPQVESANGRMVPALGYLEQWNRLLEKAAEGKLTQVETLLMIQSPGFDQASLYQYEQARELSVTLLRQWLVKYKFKDWLITETRQKNVTEQMKQRRAESIAKKLNDTKRWHSHGHGISLEVLQRDLNLRIDDLDREPGLSEKVRLYYSLLDDYMVKRRSMGVIHTVGSYLPFA